MPRSPVGPAGEIQDVGVATDDWVTVEDTLQPAVATWYAVTSSVVWPLDADRRP